MGCNCGKKTYNMTTAQLEEQRLQAELEQRMAEETAMASTGEHDPAVSR